MIVSLDEMKKYLRVDFDDDDSLITHLIQSSDNHLKKSAWTLSAQRIEAF